MHPALSLKALLAGGSIVEAPGAYDALSARQIERAGFPAVYMTGFGATWSSRWMAATPDWTYSRTVRSMFDGPP